MDSHAHSKYSAYGDCLSVQCNHTAFEPSVSETPRFSLQRSFLRVYSKPPTSALSLTLLNDSQWLCFDSDSVPEVTARRQGTRHGDIEDREKQFQQCELMEETAAADSGGRQASEGKN